MSSDLIQDWECQDHGRFFERESPALLYDGERSLLHQCGDSNRLSAGHPHGTIRIRERLDGE